VEVRLRAFGWLPIPVFYVEDLGGFAGKGFGFWILVLEQYRTDRGLHEHELEHCEQALLTLLVGHKLLYWLSRRYRLLAEVQAYRRQIAAYGAGASIEFAVQFLATRYDLQITEAEARRLLTA
jgi:hypothetical protein